MAIQDNSPSKHGDDSELKKLYFHIDPEGFKGRVRLILLRILTVSMWVAGIVLCLMMAVYGWHSMMPDSMCWLSVDQVGSLRISLGVIFGSGFMLALGKKIIGFI